MQPSERGIEAVKVGMLANAGLAAVKLAAGIFGHTYALVADAIESTTDIFSSLIVWRGLHVASKAADEDYPFGYGKAESIASATVALILLGAAVGIAVQATGEIRTPHRAPAPWTLLVLSGVIVVKWWMGRRVAEVGSAIGSGAVKADAWHHLSDALTSGAAFIGISIAVFGSRYRGGSNWAAADDWAALAASAVILFNGLGILRAAIHDLMDRAPSRPMVDAVRRAAEGVARVRATEKIAVRKAGLGYRVTLHVQADPAMSLEDAHVLSGMVKRAIRAEVPQVDAVLVHMEPFGDGQ